MSLELKSGSLGIGAVVFWSLSGVRVSRETMSDAFDRLGLKAAVPRAPSPSACLSQATRGALKGASSYRFDRVRDDAGAVVDALSRGTVDPTADEISWTQVGRVSFRKDLGVLTHDSDTEEAAGICLAAGAGFSEHRDYATTSTLTTALRHAMRGRRRDLLLGAVNLRGESGGVYFVQSDRVSTVRDLAAWIDVNQWGRMTVLDVEGSPSSRAGVSAAAASTILDRVAEVMASADDVARQVQAASEEQVDRILEPTIARLELIESQILLYSDVLDSVRDELAAKAQAARAAILERCV